MQKNIKYILIYILLNIITACSNNPNSVTMTATQGTCVQSSMYRQAPAAINNNPATAPYCTAITLQNNNSGTNANNIQVTSSGLQLSYTITPNISYTPTTMYDPVAAGLNISSSSESLGNISLYDPSNCVTTNGANVVVLNSGGGSCTFYLQLNGEEFPVGVYPINLAYNYTNGNQNFTLYSTINQRVNLYAGTTQGIAFANNLQPGTALWNSGLSNVATSNLGAVSSLTSDVFGNIYIASANQVMLYNGLTLVQLGANFSTPVIGLSFDNNQHLYASNAAGIYYYNPISASWIAFNGGGISESSNVISIVGSKSQIAYLYATTSDNNVFSCVNPNPTESSPSCNWTQINQTESFTLYQNNIAIDPAGNLYVGSNLSAYYYSPTNWYQYAFGVESATISGQVKAMYYSILPTATIYLGQTPSPFNVLTESAVFSCNNGSNTCVPLVSTANANLTGNIAAITTDGQGNLYIGGNLINSHDFVSLGLTNTLAAYLLVGESATSTQWLPINNGNVNNASVQTLFVASMLTTY